MNIEYIKNVIAPKREQEIAEGKNAATENPIYVVLDLIECIVSGHSDYGPITNNKNKEMEFGYITGEDEERHFTLEVTDEEVTRFWIDRFIAFFLTSEAAHDYIKYQRHNMTDPYVYVFHPGYKNWQMREFFMKPKI